MSILGKFIGRTRLRRLARALAQDASASNYVALAREHVVAGNPGEVLRVCIEGLEFYPGNTELQRLRDRANRLHLDRRIQTLYAELELGARPAIWRELCDALLGSGRSQKALNVAEEWHAANRDAEAVLYRAKAWAQSFYSDRKAEFGRTAYELAIAAKNELGNDARPIELLLEIAYRCGAWQDARKSIARLLEMRPGDPALEARFRSVLAKCEDSMPIEQCLVRVERTGRLTDDEPDAVKGPTSVAVRPLLQELSADSEVRGAIYLRGGTALVQGPRGATADRTARAVREVVQSSRSAARRMVLGRATEVLMEGGFGSLLLSPGDDGTAALWCHGSVKRKHQNLLKKLSGDGGHLSAGSLR